MKYILVIIMSIFLNTMLHKVHSSRYNLIYDETRLNNKELSQNEIFNIVCEDFSMKVLSTLLNRDCSIIFNKK